MNARVESPRDLAAALQAMQQATDRSCVLAGGTDLIVEFHIGRTTADLVVDLRAVNELRGIFVEDGGLRIGALTSCTDLLQDPLVASHADILRDACRDFGAVQIRNRATVGGNLGTASPAADLNPVLLALGASVRLVAHDDQRELPASEFLTGYRTNARRTRELIHSVWIPPRPPGERRAFRKVGTREAQSISKVVVAIAGRMDGDRVAALSAAAGSVAPRTVELPTLPRELLRTVPTVASVRDAARRAARDDVSPVDDVRSTERYRRTVLARILERELGTVLLR